MDNTKVNSDIKTNAQTTEYTTRSIFLDEVESIVNNDRAKAYGTAEDSFHTIANLWNAYLQAKGVNATLNPLDVALMMDLMKTARLANNLMHKDSWIDKAGYSACGGGIVMQANKETNIVGKAIASAVAKEVNSKEQGYNGELLAYTRVTENGEGKIRFGNIEEGFKGRYLFQILGEPGYFKSVNYYTNPKHFPRTPTFTLLGYTEIQSI